MYYNLYLQNPLNMYFNLTRVPININAMKVSNPSARRTPAVAALTGTSPVLVHPDDVQALNQENCWRVVTRFLLHAAASLTASRVQKECIRLRWGSPHDAMLTALCLTEDLRSTTDMSI